MNRWYLIGLSLLISGSLISDPPDSTFPFEKKSLLSVLEKVIPPGTQVILPQRAADLDTLKNQQIILPPSQEKNAWSLIKTYLELSGYSMAQRNNQFIIVNQKSVKGGAPLGGAPLGGAPLGGAIHREVLPVFAETLEGAPTDDTQIKSRKNN